MKYDIITDNWWLVSFLLIKFVDYIINPIIVLKIRTQWGCIQAHKSWFIDELETPIHFCIRLSSCKDTNPQKCGQKVTHTYRCSSRRHPNLIDYKSYIWLSSYYLIASHNSVVQGRCRDSCQLILSVQDFSSEVDDFLATSLQFSFDASKSLNKIFMYGSFLINPTKKNPMNIFKSDRSNFRQKRSILKTNNIL